MNSKGIFNIVLELSKMQDEAIRAHNKSLAEQLSKNREQATFNLSKNKS
jgi:hypothetical protein